MSTPDPAEEALYAALAAYTPRILAGADPVAALPAMAAPPSPPEGLPSGLPSGFLVGTLHHPFLRLRHPVRLAVAQDGEFVTVVLDEIDEFGYGSHLTAAVEDWQQTITELYETLRAERERLGPAMQELWERLQTIVEERP